MLATQLPEFEKWLKTTELAQDRMWHRDLERISDTELQLFYARARLRGLRQEACDAIERLQSALILGAVQGQVSDAALRLVAHEVPQQRFTADEFIDGLIKLRPARRAAVLYALHDATDPGTVEELTWSQVKGMRQIKTEVLEILRAQVRIRMLRLPYVFWEWADDRTATPVRHLAKGAEAAFGCSWPALVCRFQDMLWCSGRSDASHFLQIVEEIKTGRL